ncbi:MAG: tRNA (adenosine(37)-N6)-dimethylallyltransferase MiaA [Methylovulum sp.]|jgi:tRNA dimethylallyltransferase|nr:tRNA (adenosine(37)-N6)-dimethylallyltransferase MiaA [Methylovulum sp.]MCF8007249.1 tRNA (adenosine(37)-N6)-dimethylallyltransferase MiaA [Methylovulum sp.]
MNKLPPVLLLMGPTASGKSHLAVQLAKAFKGEIISVDSALVFKGMDIGTAKPTLAEREGIVHHLIDILDPAEVFSTGQFYARATNLMADITARHKVPILVGGTMLYFNALTQGLAELPHADPHIRAKLAQDLLVFGNQALHQRLAEIDPEAAVRIHQNDPQRVQRALEVYELTGQPMSSLFASTKSALSAYHVAKVMLAPVERKTLHDIIAWRFQEMLAQGLLEEVNRLFLRGDLHEQLPAIRAVGYRQVWSYLRGEYELNEMTEKAIIATRQLAKRQFTWLRKQHDAQFFQTGDAHLVAKVRSFLHKEHGIEYE